MSDPIYFIKSAGGDVDGVIKDASVDMIYRSMEPTFVDGSVIDSGQLQDDSVGDVVNRTDYLPVEQDTTAYIVRGFDYNSSSFHANIGFYDADLNVIEVIPYNNSVDETVMLVKPPIGSRFVAFTKINNGHDYSIVRVVGRVMSTEIAVIDRVVYDITHMKRGDVQQGNFVQKDGIITTIYAPTSGSVWPFYQVLAKDLPKSNIFDVAVNITDINGTYNLSMYYTTNSGEKKVSPIIIGITTSGLKRASVDMNYYAVYEDWNGGDFQITLFNTSSTVSSTKEYYITFNRFDTLEKVSNLSEDGISVNDALNDLSSRITSGGSSQCGDFVLANPDGMKYAVQVDDDGSIVTVPVIPSKVLYIGNSLLLGFVTHGMASYDTSSDYYALVNSYISSKASSPTVDRLQANPFEGCTSDEEAQEFLDTTLQPLLTSDLDLIVIQLGDNVNTDERNKEFTRSCGMMCSYVRKKCPNARVAWVAMWYSTEEKQKVVSDACDRYGVTFIDIHDLNTAENQSKVGAQYVDSDGQIQTITNPGVATHPGNSGMKAIAERIIQNLFDSNFSY